jgi:cytochrome c-type biogenesis protein CcmF
VIRLIGYSATLFSLGIAVYGAIAAFWGVRSKREEILASVRSAAYATFGLMLVANLAMIYGLVTHDFSISYVAQVGSRATPFVISVISLWSALEGSILFWGLVLAFCAAAVAWIHRNERSDMFAARTA